MNRELYVFLFAMWILVILGGGFLVIVMGPLEFHGFGKYDLLLSSTIKGIVAIGLVVLWIIILYKMKNWFFKKEIKL